MTDRPGDGTGSPGRVALVVALGAVAWALVLVVAWAIHPLDESVKVGTDPAGGDVRVVVTCLSPIDGALGGDPLSLPELPDGQAYVGFRATRPSRRRRRRCGSTSS